MTVDVASLIVFAAPVSFAALGETIGQKSGVLNIGLEGMMLGGSFAAVAMTSATGSPWMGLAAGAAVGLISGLISALFTVWLDADQVVVGTAVNLLALGVTGTLFRMQFGQSGSLISVPKLAAHQGIDGAILLLAFLVGATAWILRKSALGLVLRACGEFPDAVTSAGHSVKRLRTVGTAISGLFGGVAGAYLCVGITGSFAENMTAGRGFIAIALVAFGRWNPIWVVAATLLIGFAESLQFTLQAMGSRLPFQLFIALPYIIALVILILSGKRATGPAALGVPYERRGS